MAARTKEKIFRNMKDFQEFYTKKEENVLLKGCKNRYYKLGVQIASQAMEKLMK